MLCAVRIIFFDEATLWRAIEDITGCLESLAIDLCFRDGLRTVSVDRQQRIKSSAEVFPLGILRDRDSETLGSEVRLQS